MLSLNLVEFENVIVYHDYFISLKVYKFINSR
jgi:hypothetical protein